MSTPDAPDLIFRKREGHSLDADQLRAVARGIGDGGWSEAQVAAFAMAVAWRGMSAAECRDFTLAVCDSGRRLDWRHLPGPALDKHSTGGVGDGVSLVLVPLLAACGAYVPMISGRGLGHTGGTLDKLESLPGYDVHPTCERLRKIVAEVGCAIVGQSADLVPADRRLYAVRDLTATVDVPDLMVASILSKKLAGGAQALVLDIKTGNGAQLPDMDATQALCERMLAAASGTGMQLHIAMSDMGQVLGREAGNALELRAAVDLLTGRGGNPRLHALTLALAAELLCMGGLAVDDADARQRLQAAMDSGAAAQCFARMVAALGGPHDLLERAQACLPHAPVQRAVLAPPGQLYVGAVDVRTLGRAVVKLGGGRSRPGQKLDHAVGLSAVAGRGERVDAGQPLAIIHARSDTAAAAVAEEVQRAFRFDPAPPPAIPLWQWYAAPGQAA